MTGLQRTGALRRPLAGTIDAIRGAGDHGVAWARGGASRVLGRPPRARRYLPPGMSVDAFLAALNTAGVRYAVLRWFDTLPDVAPGEDIDLLIGDEDLPMLETMVTPHHPLRRSQKIDLYTVSGLPGTDFRGVPYLPKRLAARVLDGAVLQGGRYRVPDVQDHLDSLAFHAAYHKGWSSGLPARSGDPVDMGSDHDYGSHLERLADRAGVPLEPSLEGLDHYLGEAGLRPATDTLERYQVGNPWLRQRLADAREDIGALAGLIVFVVRDAAEAASDEIVSTIDEWGFEILRTVPLDADRKGRVTEAVRGGNWGRGPFPTSGGDPTALVVAYDANFALRGEREVNSRAVAAKNAARDLIAQRTQSMHRFNPLHSSDNGWQSLEYLAVLDDPALTAEVLAAVDEIEHRFTSPWPIERFLSAGRRARVAVVRHPEHGEAVLKQFRPGARAFLERELLARQELGDLALVPPLIAYGDDWILTPLLHDTHAYARRILPGTGQAQLTFAAARSLAQFVDALRLRGFFLLDLTTHNLLHDRDAGLLVMDYEFLQRYPGDLPALDQDYTVQGTAGDRRVDQPVHGPSRPWNHGVWKTAFHPALFGLPVASMVRSRAIGLRARMAVAQLAWFLVFLGWETAHRTVQLRVLRGALVRAGLIRQR